MHKDYLARYIRISEERDLLLEFRFTFLISLKREITRKEMCFPNSVLRFASLSKEKLQGKRCVSRIPSYDLHLSQKRNYKERHVFPEHHFHQCNLLEKRNQVLNFSLEKFNLR